MAILQSKPWPRSDLEGEKYRACRWCGDSYTRYELAFDSGSVAPTVGETLTGATSTDTAVVVSTDLESGSYAGGDAVGVVELSTGTGVSDDGDIFADNENINGSTGGANMMTANGVGSRKIYGRLYPESEMAFRDGKFWCQDHYLFEYGVKDLADWAKGNRVLEDNE